MEMRAHKLTTLLKEILNIILFKSKRTKASGRRLIIKD